MEKKASGIKSTKDFINRMEEYYGKQFSYIDGNYKNRDSLITMECNKCGYSEPRKVRQLIMYECPGCKGNGKLTTELYKKKVYDSVGYEYFVLGEYKSGKSKILMQHNICGHRWEVIAKNFIRSNNPTRCPKCSNSSKMTHKTFLSKFNKITNSESFKILNECEGKESFIKLECNKCHKINRRKVSSILRNSEYIQCFYCENNQISKGIKIIMNYLDTNNIKYSNECFFRNFKSLNGNYFKYDIFLNDYNLLIEFDGEQHFEENNRRFSEDVRFRDLLKNRKIIISDKYSLLRISYKEINSIKEILNDIIFDKGSTTIRKYNLLYISENSCINYNLQDYYTSRSTFKQTETGDTIQYNLGCEDIVSTSSES